MEHTHEPASSSFLRSVKINHNWSILILTAVGCEGAPAKIWALTLALDRFVRLLLTHSCRCKAVPLTGGMNTQTAALWPAGFSVVTIVLVWGREN